MMNHDDQESELDDLRAEARWECKQQRLLRAHPDCRDPDHPGCEDCEDDSEWDFEQMNANN